MRHPKVDKLEELINTAYEALCEAQQLADQCRNYAHDVSNDMSLEDMIYYLHQAESALERPYSQFTEVYWKSYKKKPIEDMASAY